MQIRKIASISLFGILSAVCANGQVSVLTQHNDNGRSGQNLNETTLNTSNVNVSNFGKLFWRTVDGFIYAQPLYVPNLQIQGAVHNVVYVATQHDSVYAFDADDPNSPAPLWWVNLGTPVPSQDICIITGDTSPADCPYYDISPEVGITSTPAIDPAAGVIYVVARTKNTTDNSYHFFLHALSLIDGSEQLGGPVEITAQVNGTGYGSQNGVVSLDPTYLLQRPSLLLQNGTLYIAFGSQGDIGSWHGWVISYNASTLQQEAVFNVSPDGDEGGIWSVGQGLVGDSSGNVYAMTSNGDFNANVQGGRDYGDSFIKLNRSSLNVSDYFTPMTQATLAADNADLGAGGPMLVPGTTLLVGQGKDGIMRVVDSTNMGGFNSAVDNDRQEFTATSGVFFSSPIYWNSPNSGPVIYVWNRGDYIKAFQYNGSIFNTTPVSEGTILGIAGFSDAAALSVSANQSLGGSGIVWANMPTAGTATGKPVPGGLWAFDATDLASELWDSSKNPARDGVGNYAKFVPPTVANGKVYLASFSGQLQVYGLNPPAFQGIQFVQAASTTPQSTTSSVALAYTSAQTAGNLNVVIVGWHDATASVQSVTDSAGNTYTLAVGPTTGNGLSESIYYAKNILSSNSNTVTVTFNQGAVNPDIRILEYSGVSTSSPLDVTASAVGNSYIANSGAVTTNAANELLVGANMIGSGNSTVMAGAPYNIRAITTTDSDLASDRMVNVPGAYYSWAPLNTSGPWIMQMVAFKAANVSTVPFISSVSPSSGPITGGTTLTITGVDFASGDTVTIGGVAATNVTVVNSATITAKTPANSAGPALVTVTNPSGQTGNLAGGFTYIAPPTVTSVSPNNGTTSGGTSVTITGTNFAAGDTVTFGSAAATNVVVVNSTTITATTTAASAGVVTVTVTNTIGQIGTLTSGFTYVVRPTVSSVSPNSGPVTGGTSVTITGTNFASGATVAFGSAAATNVTVVNSTTITATTPANTSGAVTVTVTANSQSGSLANAFTYGSPTVSRVSPSDGSAAGGTAVTITGTNFAPGATVTFGGGSATNVVVVNSTTITATTPANGGGVVTVTVTNTGGQSGSLTNGFTYYVPAAIGFAQVASSDPQTPSATVSVTYPAAQTLGDMNIVVVGWNDTTSTVQSVTDSSGNTYSVAVGMTNGSGIRQAIYYAPNIVAGTNTVTVTFSQAAAYPDIRILEYKGVTLLDATAAASGTGTTANSGSTTTASANELIFGADTITTTTKAAGTGFTSRIVTSPDSDLAEDEVVTTAGSYSATATLSSSGAWVMQMATFATVASPAPTVTGVSPNSGSTAGGTSVTITGMNFVSGATVMIGGAAATNVTVVNSTTITATSPAGTAGAATVTVTQGGQSGSLASGFTYVVPPTVTGVNPSNGPLAGGTSVTITGTGFATGATVTFGSAAATNVTVVNSTTITAMTSAGTAGAVTVTVTNTNGLSGNLAGGFTYVGYPTVASVSPVSGSTGGGTVVTITGTGFAAGATVTFGSAAATNVTVVNSTTITATTPAGSAGSVTVTVTNIGNLSGSLAKGYTYAVVPTVTSVNPNSGPTSGGTSVTITGTNFASGATVTFGSTAATNVTVVNSTTISATAPAGSAGAVTVTVTVSGQSASLTNGFTYIGQPTVTSVSPNNGPVTGGTSVTITGTNFVTGATVTFGGTAAANVTVVSSTSITATTPAGSVGAVTVAVTNTGNQSGSLTNGFTYNASVAIGFAQVASSDPQTPSTTVSVTYPSAQTAGDMNIVVVGWNDTTSTVQSVTDSAGNTYSVAVGMTNGSGIRQAIYYAPGIVAGTNTVTVTFSQAAAYPDIRILEYKGVTALDMTAAASGSGTTASTGSVTTTSANELIFAADTITTTTNAAGTGFTARVVTSPDSDLAEDKIVTTAGSYSATAALNSGSWVMQMATFAAVLGPAPTVTGVSPSSGSTAGGTSVTITGTNFASGATVTIGGAAATNVTVVNSTTITATTPAGTAGSAIVSVTVGGQSGSLASGFTYVAPPTITNLSPSNGPIAGGTSVTITGTNFASGASVTFGGTAATNVNVVNSTTITATTPAGSAGAVTVTVTNTNGLAGSLASGFSYVAPPTVTGISPNTGSTSGGTSVTITGTNFASGATVTFGSTAATSVTVVNSTTITATTPAGSAGAVTVTVTNVGNLSGSLTSGFTYVVRPTVTSLAPSSGPVAGGTSVTITGTNFASGATVTFGSASATNVTVVNSTTITATTPAGSVGAVTVTVTVSGQSGSLTNGFTYIGQPAVTSVSPNIGSTSGGTSVTITGTNFATGAIVTFGGTAATNVTVVSSTSITATTPAGSAGAVTVTVTNSGNQSGSLASGFTYVAPSFALSASPTSVSVAQGSQGTTTITSSIVGGFNNSVSLAASGLPTGTTAAFNPGTIAAPGSGNSTMTFTVGSTTPVGTYTVTVTGTGNGTQQTVNVSLTVTGSSSSPCSNTNLGNGVTCVAVVSASNVTGTPVTSLSTTGSLSVQPGDTLVAEVRYLSAADTNGAVSVETSAGDRLYYATGTTGSNGGWAEQIYYICGAIPNAASTPTVYFYTSQAYTSLIVHQYRGLVTHPAYNSCLDATATGVVASGTSVTSSPFTTTQPNEIAFAAGAVDNNGISFTAGPGYTKVATDPGGQVATEQAAFTSIQTNATASMSFPSNPGIIAVATFVAGSAIPGAGIPAGHGVYVWAAVTDSSSTCGGNCVLTVADSKNNSYSVLQTNNQTSANVTNYLAFGYTSTALAGDGSDWVKCSFYKHNGTTPVTSTDNTYCRVFDMSQVASSGFLDSTSQNTDSSNQPNSGALTVSSGNTDLVFAIWDISSATETVTPGAGFTGILNSLDTQGGAQYAEYAESTSGVTPTITLSTGVSSYGAGAAIKESAQGGTVASVNGLVGQHVNSSSLIVQIPEWYGSSTTPAVTNVSPSSGSIAGGTSVTITGTNFASGATVTFGSTAATNVTVVNSTTITATTPASGSAGAVTVAVTNTNGTAGSLASGFTYVAPPTVTSVTPSQGSTSGGTSVTITGTNFASGATVAFGSVAATNVTVVSSTTITATAPANSVGAVTVTVTNPGSQSGSLANGFTYVVIPTVASVNPSSGPTTGGTSVTITGTNFASGATVTFGTTSATNVVVVNSTTITATTPAGSAGAVTVTVTVSGQSGSLANAFIYGQPTVTGVSPTNGPVAGGTSVTITGTNFFSGATVTFGSVAATNVVVVNSTTITATTPTVGSGGAVTVTVTNNGGQSGSLSNGFTYYVPAAIGFAQVAYSDPQTSSTTVSVSYLSAQILGDMNIVVVGWNDTTSTVQSVTDSAGNKYSLAVGPTTGSALRQSIYYAPNIVAGTNTVTVTFSKAAAYPDIRILEYKGVTMLDVTAAASGSGATASSGSATTTSANELIFAADTISTTTKAAGTGFTARVVSVPDSDLAEDKIVTAAGSNSATATLNSGAWVMQMATFAAATSPVPTVTGLSPSSGSAAGGTSVTITGTNFASGATVMIGGAAATNVTVVNSTTITATTPAGTAGAATVSVTVGGQTGSLTSGFTYVAPPAVTSLSQSSGPIAGGTSVTITGANFAAGATVKFGSAAATNVTVVNSTTITAITPANSAGAVAVTVTNTNGLAGSLVSGFTYVAPSTVTAVSPNSGSNLGGDSVTVTGTNFISGDSVTFGGAAATNVIVVNSTTITATTPAGSTGAVTVAVTDPFGQSGSLTSGFTYTLTASVTAPGSFNAALAGTVTPTYVSGQQYYNSTTLASHTTAAFNSTGADLLVAFISSHNNVAFTVTDSYGNTWLPLAGPASSVGSQNYPLEGEYFYAPNAKTGANHTITVGLSQAQPLIMSIAAIAGDNVYSPIDAYSPINGDNGTFSDYIYSSPLTTYQSNDMLFGIAKGYLDKTFTAGTGYVNQSASTGLNFGAETGTAAVTGTYRTNFTANEQDYWQSGLTAVAPKPNLTNLSWTASVGGPITNYFIERCSGVGCANFTQIGSVSGSTLTYTDTTISAGTIYSYRVRAENSGGMFSNYSTVQLVSPIVPTVVSSLTANSLKTLAWNASVESGGTISRYSIERCQGAGCTNFTPLTTTTSTSYTDSSAAAGTIYSYRIRAQDANSFFGPYSAVATMDVPAYLDNAADGGNNGGTTSSLTYQYTVGTNANRLLVVNVAGSTSVDDISSVTYGGASLSLIKKIQTPSGNWHYLYYLLSPASGINNVVITAASAHFLASEACSWYNVTQSGPQTSVTNTSLSGQTLTASLPASANNAIAVESMWAPNEVLPGNGSTELIADAASQTLGFFSSAASPVASAYPLSITNTWGGEQPASSITASFLLASNGATGITFDNAADGGNNGGSTATLSYAYTVGSGSNRLLIVNVIGGVSADDISSVTYAGTPMILLGKVQASSNAFQYVYYLLNPASGSNNVVITAASSHYLISQAASWSGVKQSAQPDAFITNSAAAAITSTTTSLTTVAAGSLVVQGVWSDSHLAAGQGSAPLIVESAFQAGGIFASTISPVSPAGNVGMTTISDGTMSTGVIMASFSPAP